MNRNPVRGVGFLCAGLALLWMSFTVIAAYVGFFSQNQPALVLAGLYGILLGARAAAFFLIIAGMEAFRWFSRPPARIIVAGLLLFLAPSLPWTSQFFSLEAFRWSLVSSYASGNPGAFSTIQTLTVALSLTAMVLAVALWWRWRPMRLVASGFLLLCLAHRAIGLNAPDPYRVGTRATINADGIPEVHTVQLSGFESREGGEAMPGFLALGALTALLLVPQRRQTGGG